MACRTSINASRELAADLDLTEFLDRPTGKLSAGQKTRVSLAKSLLNKPEVLLLDEPTASLDPDTADWVRCAARALSRRAGRDLLLASHNMGEVERLCERVIIMKKGRIEDDDTPARLLARYGRETSGRGVSRRRARTAAERGGAMRTRAKSRNRMSSITDTGMDFSFNRVAAMVRRYWYLLALVLAAHARPDLLAGRADADVGLSAALRFAERRLLRAGRRHVHRRGAAVGHPVPRPARVFDLVSRGDVRAQPRQPDDVAAASGRISRSR